MDGLTSFEIKREIFLNVDFAFIVGYDVNLYLNNG